MPAPPASSGEGSNPARERVDQSHRHAEQVHDDTEGIPMSPNKILLAAAAAAAFLVTPAHAEMASCTLSFNLAGWSLIYKQMKGDGKVTCSNGQTADVHIASHGGGFTIGKSDIVDGNGTFSAVKDISEVFGTYVQAEASAGATKGGAANAMTKGEISLAIAGAGRGWDVGVTLGSFSIHKK
jgi:hypothetical protein